MNQTNQTVLRYRPCRDDDEVIQTMRSSVIKSDALKTSKYAADMICLEDDFNINSDEFFATVILRDVPKLKEKFKNVGV